jgi:peptide/nickel transport system substrate-binding protein
MPDSSRSPGPWQRVRLSRRRALRTGALGTAGLSGAVLLACSSKTNNQTSQPAPPAKQAGAAVSATAAAAKQPRRGGTISLGQAGGQPGLDPHIDSPVLAVYESFTYEGLVSINHYTLDVQPLLAQKWEQPDQTTYVFHLQPGVKFQNKPPVSGRAMTADDVVFSLNRVKSPGARFTSRTLLDGFTITAPDAATVKVTTSKPEGSFFSKIGGAAMMVVAKELLEKIGGASEAGKINTPDQVLGTGPYIYQAMVPGLSSELVRNPDYWKQGQPYIDNIKRLNLFTSTGNEQTWAAFISGQLDVMSVPGNRIKDFLASKGPGYQPLFAKDPAPYQSVPNTKVKPFDDARVTRALRLLLDHDELVSAWMEPWSGKGGYASYLATNLDAWELSKDDFGKQLEYQKPKDAAVKEALSLLSAAGFTKDKPLKFVIMSEGDWDFLKAGAELVQAQFARLGQGVVQTTLKLTDRSSYQTLRANRDYEFGVLSNATSYDDPDAWFTQVYASNAGRNYWNHSDPKLDALFDKQRSILDLNQRKAAVKEALLAMLDSWPGSTLSQSYVMNGINPKLQGFTPEVFLEGYQYKNVWLSA